MYIWLLLVPVLYIPCLHGVALEWCWQKASTTYWCFLILIFSATRVRRSKLCSRSFPWQYHVYIKVYIGWCWWVSFAFIHILYIFYLFIFCIQYVYFHFNFHYYAVCWLRSCIYIGPFLSYGRAALLAWLILITSQRS